MDTLLFLIPVFRVYILSFGLPGTANTIYYVFREKNIFGIFPFITFCGNFGDSP